MSSNDDRLAWTFGVVPGGSYTFGQRVRVDDGRGGAAWCLRGIKTSGVPLDDPSTDLAFADLRDELQGRGWRRVPGLPR